MHPNYKQLNTLAQLSFSMPHHNSAATTYALLSVMPIEIQFRSPNEHYARVNVKVPKGFRYTFQPESAANASYRGGLILTRHNNQAIRIWTNPQISFDAFTQIFNTPITLTYLGNGRVCIVASDAWQVLRDEIDPKPSLHLIEQTHVVKQAVHLIGSHDMYNANLPSLLRDTLLSTIHELREWNQRETSPIALLLLPCLERLLNNAASKHPKQENDHIVAIEHLEAVLKELDELLQSGALNTKLMKSMLSIRNGVVLAKRTLSANGEHTLIG